jgi:2',3'-cyclic-nucleotide 2'-phosphodiesterase (5'-nucleotidase family)
MKTKKHNFLAVILCLLASWGFGREVAVTLLYTADIHGHLVGATSDRDAAPAGGLLRCAALVRDVRIREPNVLLIDGGDLFQGAAESFLTRGDILIDTVKAMRYDALVVGNHEFDWGLANLLRLYARTEIPILAANISANGAGGGKRFPWRPFLVKELDGVRVAVVGLANPLTSSWIRPRLLGGLSFDTSVETLRRILPAVREQRPDVMVLALHQGYRQWGDDAANEVNAIARAFPEFDVILGAHTHRAVHGFDLHGIIYIHPECYGRWLAKVNLRVDPERHRVTKRVAELIAVKAEIKPDSALQALCAKELREARSYQDREIGAAARAHLAQSDFNGQSQVQTLIARAILDAVKADVVFHGTLTEASLSAGRIAMRDVWRIVPYENTIGVACLTREELGEILEENSRYLNSGQFRGVYGVTYELVAGRTNSGNKARNIRLAGGRDLEEGERIRVAFNSYDLASAGERFARLRAIADRPSARLEETDLDTREAVIAYIRKHQPLDERAVEGVRIVLEKRIR